MFWFLKLVEILMFGWDFEVNAWSRFWNWIFDQDLCKNLWYELNPRVRCAFGNVSISAYMQSLFFAKNIWCNKCKHPTSFQGYGIWRFEWYCTLFWCTLRNMVEYALLCYCWFSIFCLCFFPLFQTMVWQSDNLIVRRSGLRKGLRSCIRYQRSNTGQAGKPLQCVITNQT